VAQVFADDLGAAAVVVQLGSAAENGGGRLTSLCIANAAFVTLGNRPALASDDLPLPDAPTTYSNRGCSLVGYLV
jgi:hypothetical protein